MYYSCFNIQDTKLEWGKTKHLTAIHICLSILFDLTTKSCKIHLHGKRDPVMQVLFHSQMHMVVKSFFFEVVYTCQDSDAKTISFRRKLKKCSPMLHSISFKSGRIYVLKLMAFHQIHFVSMAAMFLASTIPFTSSWLN